MAPQVESLGKKREVEKIEKSPECGRDHVAGVSSRLKPLRRHAPVGGHHYDRAHRFLEVMKKCLLELVSPRML